MDKVNILYDNITNNIPFCFIKINDGECSIINNSDPSIIASRGDQCSSELLSQKLRECLTYSHPNYYIGLPCSQCHHYDMSKYITNNTNILNANILINSNTNHTIDILSTNLRDKYVVVITNKNLMKNIDKLKLLNISVSRIIEVEANNAFDNDYERIADLWKTIPDYSYIICLCGPLGRVICYEWFKNNNNLFCLELGSLFDPLLKNRSYSYHQNTLRLCTECNPNKLDKRAFDLLIPDYSKLETECFYFDDLSGYLLFYNNDLKQIFDVLSFRSGKNDFRGTQLLNELQEYKSIKKISFKINLHSDDDFSVYYGTERCQDDITEKFISTFKKNNIIYIPRGTVFNTHFGDPCYGQVKNLFLNINGKEYIIDEKNIRDLEFELNICNIDSIKIYCELVDVKIDVTDNYIDELNKNNFIIISNIKRCNVRAYYGTDDIKIDVTEKFVSVFGKNNKIIIPQHISFNSHFGDPCIGCIKHVTLAINNTNYFINEKRIGGKLVFNI
jgi:hypothetical protein